MILCLTAGQSNPFAHVLSHCVDLYCAINTRLFAPATAADGGVLPVAAGKVIAIPLLQEQLASPGLAGRLLHLVHCLAGTSLVLLCGSPASVAWRQELCADTPEDLADRLQVMGHVSRKKYCSMLQRPGALLLPRGPHCAGHASS